MTMESESCTSVLNQLNSEILRHEKLALIMQTDELRMAHENAAKNLTIVAEAYKRIIPSI